MVNGGQLTVIWHVDDLIVSHVDPRVVTDLTERLKSIHSDLKVNIGKRHGYLGMDLDFSTVGEVIISMVPYAKNIIKEFQEELGKSVMTPAGEHLFTI